MDPVLIVEDEPSIARLVQRLLESHGMPSRITARADEAVAWLGRETFSAVLLDYQLEDGPGWPVLEAARAGPDHTPVIMMSGQGDEALAAEAVQRGAADFRLKSDHFWKLIGGVVERVARQAESERTHAMLASIVESSDDAIIGITGFGDVVSWNPAAAALFGRPLEEVLGRPFSDFLVPEGEEDFHEALGSDQGDLRRLETVGLTSAGGRFDLALTVSIIRAGTGRAEACVTARDVTVRRRAQRELELGAQRQAAVAELGRQALQGGELPLLLERAVALAAQTCGTEYAAVLELVAEGDPPVRRLRRRTCHGSLVRETPCEGCDGAAGSAAEIRMPVLSDNLRRAAWFGPPALLLQEGGACGLSVAIEGESEPFGLFEVYAAKRRRFNRDDIDFLESLAHVLSSAVQRDQARLAQLERDRLLAFEVEIFRLLSRHTDAATLLAGCVEATLTHLGAEVARAWVLNAAGDMLEAAASVGGPTTGEPASMPLDACTMGRIAATGRSDSSNTCPSHSDPGMRDWARRTGMVAFAGQPLVVEGRVEGVLALFSREPLSPAIPPVLHRVAVGIAQALARLRSQRQLADSEAKFKGIFDQMQDGYATVDMRTGRLTLVNPAAVRLLGYDDAEDLLAVPMTRIFHDRVAQDVAVAETLEKGCLVRSISKGVRKDGSVRTFEGSTRIHVDGDGRPLTGEAVFRDVTEQVEAEEAHRARVAADEASRLKTQFLAHMSHEIRTPLNAILGMAHLALGTELTELQGHYLDHIERGGRTLLSIVNDILDFSKVEAGQMDLERVPFRLDEVIGDLVSVLAISAEEKGLDFLVRVDPDVPAHLSGDAVRLGQVLLNLVHNAIKFTAFGQVVLSVSREGTRVRFDVSDTGIGLTPEQIQGLFVPFAQADSTITRKHGGTGLGLVICHRLVRLMQGDISVASVPSLGTTFSFTILLEPVDGPEEGRRPDLDRLRALVLDSHRSSRSVLVSALRGLSVQVTDHATVDLAPPDSSWDLVFLDRPESLETLRRAVGARVPVVLLTGHRGGATPAGVTAALARPFTRSHLVDLILTVVGAPEVRLAPVPTSRRRQSQEVLKALTGARVLLVEDNAINQEISRELLESAGLQVDVVGDGSLAVERVLGCGPVCPWQAILMDLQMPEMDGYTATAAIRADGRFPGLPILAMTAHVLPEERQRCEAAGMNDYISKPIDPRALFATLRRWIPVAEPAALPRGTFPAIPGIDTVAGLSRVAGNQGLYRSLLLALAGETSKALEAAGPEQLRALAHTMKGAAGNLGLVDVSREAGELERSAGQATPAAASLARLLPLLADSSDRIRTALEGWQPPDRGPVAPVDSRPATIAAATARLESLLRKSDGSAGDALERLQQLLRAGELDAVRELVDRFEFAAALVELRRFQAERVPAERV